VIAIIAILAGMLLPSLGKAKEAAKGVACQNQLKQLDLKYIIYADENNDWTLPYFGRGVASWGAWDGQWFGLMELLDGTSLSTSNNKAYTCPAVTVKAFWGDMYPGIVAHTYVMSTQLSPHLGTVGSQRISSLTHGASDQSVFADGGTNVCPSAYCYPQTTGTVLDNNSEFNWKTIWMQHNGRSNLAWLDGHVASVSAREIKANEQGLLDSGFAATYPSWIAWGW